MNDDEGEGQEDPEREYEHGSHQVDDVVPARNCTPNMFLDHQVLSRLTNPTAKTMKV